MALTEAQKSDIRLYLGWSARFFQYDSRLEMAMSALETRPEHETQVIALLVKLTTIDAEIEAARSRFKADKVGSITLRKEEPDQLRDEGRMFAKRIASILGVEIRNDIFSPANTKPLPGAYPSNYVGK
jgi:hypothetical protein